MQIVRSDFRKVPLFIFLVLLVPPVLAQYTPDRKLLAQTYPLETLGSVLVPRESWKPFPTIEEPDGFEKIPQSVRQAYIQEAEKLLETSWAPLPASVFLEFVRSGNRSNFEALTFGRRRNLATLVLAEAFERKGRFMDQILNGVWAICEESFWGVPAHIGAQKAGPGLPDVSESIIDLFAAETGMLLAWTHYLVGTELNKISPLITARIETEVDRRILTPFLERDDFGWMGFRWRNNKDTMRPVNNWNPWINSNVLACALLLEKDPERRIQLVYKVMDSVDNFMEPYPSDGGCDEGPSYWSRAGGSLFDTLELLHSASNSRIDIFDQPLIREIGRYIYRTYIDDTYYLNFADASARMNPEAPLIYRYGKAIEDPTLTGFGVFLARQQNLGSDVVAANFGALGRALPALFVLDEMNAGKPVEPLVRDTWFPDLEVAIARSTEGSNQGFYIAAKGGHNAESHNHNDVGNFILYHDGRPVLIDAGAQTYTAQTFSSRRYELWNNQSAYHNVPSINGVMQQAGASYSASEIEYEADDKRTVFSLDLAGAYPEEAAVESWKRTVTLNRGKNVTIREDYQLSSYVAPTTLNFLTPLEPDVSTAGQVRLTDPTTSRTYVIAYDTKRFEPSFEKISISDNRMTSSWGSELIRVVLTSKTDRLKDRFDIRIETAS